MKHICNECRSEFARRPAMECPACGHDELSAVDDKASKCLLRTQNEAIDKAIAGLKKEPLKIRYGGIENL